MERLAILAPATVRRVPSVFDVALAALAALAALVASHADTIGTFEHRPVIVTAPVQFVRLLSGVPRPASVAVSPDGRVTVTDNATRLTKVFLSSGDELALLPAPREAEESPSSPFGVAVDEAGHTYISDPIHKEVLVYRTDDRRPSPFAGPEWGARIPGALFARDGRLYVADIGMHQIVVIDIAREKRVAVIGAGEGDGLGELRYPNGVWVSPEGVIYVSDTNNDRIQRFTADGTAMSSWSGPFKNPRGLAGDGNGRLFVANTLAHEVLVIDHNGTPIGRIDRAGSRELGFPTGLALVNDRLLVTDRDAQGVFEWKLTEGRRTQ